MSSNERAESTRNQLIRNAEFRNLPDRRFLERMNAQARQDIKYGLHTSCGGVELEIEVLASGVMTLKSSMPYALIEDGRLSMRSDTEQVVWSDTGETAMIPTSLGRKHLREEITRELIVDAFLGAFGLHTTAAGDTDYDHWHTAMDLYAKVVAGEISAPVQIIHHLPLMMPYVPEPGGKSPLSAESTCQVFDLSDIDHPDEQIQYRPPIMKIQKMLQPEAMELVLHLPSTIVRRQHRAMFEAEPDGQSLAECIRDFNAHMRGSEDLKRTA